MSYPLLGDSLSHCLSLSFDSLSVMPEFLAKPYPHRDSNPDAPKRLAPQASGYANSPMEAYMMKFSSNNRMMR